MSIKIRNKATTAPSALDAGELAVRTANTPALFVGDGSSVVTLLGAPVQAGTVDDRLIHWDAATSSWVENANATITEAGAATFVSLYTSGSITTDNATITAAGAGNFVTVHTTGNITTDGLVDTVNLASFKSSYDSHAGDSDIHFSDTGLSIPQARTSSGWVDALDASNVSAVVQAYHVVTLTASEFSGLTPNANTLYFVVG
jgi:hypothetical protein